MKSSVDASSRHLSPDQFGSVTVSEGDGLNGPLGSYGSPDAVGAYWQNSGAESEYAGGQDAVVNSGY